MIIILSVLLFFALLFFLPVSVRLSYNKKIGLKVYYAGIKVYDINKPKKENEQGEEEREKETSGHKVGEKEKKELFLKRDFEKMEKIEFIKYYSHVLKDVLVRFKSLIKRFTFTVFDITVSVASDDAMTTAVEFGAVSAAISPVVTLILQFAKVKRKSINIYADFVGDSMYVKTDIKLSVKLLFLAIFAKRLFSLYKALDNGTYMIKEQNKTTDSEKSEENE
ncbi:MAG: DUF2953 domain-containing protein [Clostridia bacterium]|nr:DUF2953 domain-containing protein [Clostridia bacterium]